MKNFLWALIGAFVGGTAGYMIAKTKLTKEKIEEIKSIQENYDMRVNKLEEKYDAKFDKVMEEKKKYEDMVKGYESDTDIPNDVVETEEDEVDDEYDDTIVPISEDQFTEDQDNGEAYCEFWTYFKDGTLIDGQNNLIGVEEQKDSVGTHFAKLFEDKNKYPEEIVWIKNKHTNTNYEISYMDMPYQEY